MSSCVKCMEFLDSKNESQHTSLLCQKCWESYNLEKEKVFERDHCRHCGCGTPSCHKVCDRCLRFESAKQEIMIQYSGAFESLARIEAQELNETYKNQIEEQIEYINDLEKRCYNLGESFMDQLRRNDILISENDNLQIKLKQLEDQLTRQTNEMNDLRKLLQVGG